MRVGRTQRARVRRWWMTRTGRPTLIFANVYTRPERIPELSGFFAHVRRANGPVRIEPVHGWTSMGDRDEERTVLEDVANGAVDLAWAGSRAVGAVFGIRSLEALHAPLLFPDEAAVARFLSSAPLESLLEPLEEVGLTGLALLPGGLRRPFGITGPLVASEDWRGKVIRTHSSITGEATLRALGATPVLRSNAELRAGPPPSIDGLDIHPEALADWGYSGWLTWNVALWPRLVLLVANRARLELLSSEARSILAAAARQAQSESGHALPVPRREDLSAAVTAVEASREGLAQLRRQLHPVYEEIRSTSEGEETLALIERHLRS